VTNEGEGRAIYRENPPPTPWQSSGRLATLAYVWWSLHVGPKGVSYVQVLPKGYTKSSVRPMVSRTSGVLFTERTSDDPPSYVRTTDKSVRPLDLAYVRPLWVSVKLLFLEDPNVIWLKLRVLGFRLSGSNKGSS
jgi:hypothetical protein